MATVETYAMPDVEAWVYAAVGGDGLGVKSWQVDRTSVYPHWVGQHLVQVDVRGSSKAAAKAAAGTALRTLMALRGSVHADGVLCEVTPIMGPSWLPDEGGQPRYVFRVSISAHP